MMFHTVRGAHPDYVAIDALGDVMTLAPSGRLYKALVETKKATARPGVERARQADPGMLTFFAQVPDGEPIEPAREAMLATFANVAKEPITEAEVARVRARAAKNFDDAIADPQAFGVAISESIALGDWRLFFLAARPLSRRHAGRRAARRARLSQALEPHGRRVHARCQARPRAGAADGRRRGDGQGLQGRHRRGRPARRSIRRPPTSTRARSASRSPNGMKVALLPKKTRGEAVSFNVALHFGDEKSVFGKAPTGALDGRHADARHGASASRQEIEDTFDKLRAKVDVDGHADACASATGQTVPRAAARRAAAHRGSAARAVVPGGGVRPAEARSAPPRSRRRAPIRRRSRDARSRRHGNPYPAGDPRYVPTIEESIANNAAATLDDVQALPRDVLRREQRRARDRRRFRRRCARALVTRALRRLEEPVAVCARARSVPAEPARGAARRSAGQGERVRCSASSACRSTT